jgi:hypothetical protein
MSYDIVHAPAVLVGAVTGKERGVLERFVFVAAEKSGRVTYHALGYRADELPYITSPLTKIDTASHKVRTASGSTWLLKWEVARPDMAAQGLLLEALMRWGIDPSGDMVTREVGSGH